MKRNASLNRQILNQFEPLLHKVLQDAFIEVTHLFYDDYLQEMRLKLLDMVDQFNGNPLGEERYKFTAFARRGLYWFVLDLQRKEQRYKKLEYKEETLEEVVCVEPYETCQMQIRAFDQKARTILNFKEIALYNLLIEGNLSVQEMADYLGCTRQTIYNQRMSIQDKLLPFKYLLSE